VIAAALADLFDAELCARYGGREAADEVLRRLDADAPE
jgi:hypothetical protein